MLIKKGGISREIEEHKLREYAERGYEAEKEKPKGRKKVGEGDVG